MIKKKKTVKKRAGRTKTKIAPSKTPGVDFDVTVKRKPAKKVVKTTVKKPKARKVETLPPVIIPRPKKTKRTIPKDVTKRAPKTVPKRKSAIERERRVQFAKKHPLMEMGTRSPSSSKRSRPALDTSMLLSPLSGILGGGIGAKGAKAVRKVVKKNSRKNKK